MRKSVVASTSEQAELAEAHHLGTCNPCAPKMEARMARSIDVQIEAPRLAVLIVHERDDQVRVSGQ